ncbi:MAG: M20/M25/M40 family metallo-hydrolase [Alphaproteobacteria bacterium]|nr:M20/M25/M40 family metallo-hydrolase [Alphaproteobacteria bacterium]MCB9792134.1 M20/M25/M40 family metallo-hydrolase [Alphaproteobacteria bacterium]
MSRLTLLGALGLCACAPATAQDAPEGSPLLADVDWDAAGEELVHVLSHYIQAPSINPPGDETLGAQVLAEVLAGEGIDAEIWEYAPGRGNLIAKLEATAPSGEGAYCMLSHIDVVPAEAELWREGIDPFGGQVAPDDAGEMMLWGRGALDMKGMGALELMTLVHLKRLGVPLRRDVVLIAVADEEVDNEGVQRLMAAKGDALGCSHVINEGGLGVEGLLFEGQTVYPISVGEKGTLWLRMTAKGEPGHGSTPRAGEAPDRLVDAAMKLRDYDPEPIFHPAILELFAAIGEPRDGVEGFVLTRPSLAKVLLEDQLMENPLTRAALTDTIHLTGLEGANEPNVVPSKASALLDCRLLPGTSPEEMLARVEALVDDPMVELEVLQQFPGNVSEWQGDPLYEALARHVVAGQPDAVAGPTLSPGFTDSIFLREMGVRAFGLMPVRLSPDELETFHGNDERVPVAELQRGLQVMLEVAIEVAAAEDAG